jgi:hypothetical protein
MSSNAGFKPHNHYRVGALAVFATSYQWVLIDISQQPISSHICLQCQALSPWLGARISPQQESNYRGSNSSGISSTFIHITLPLWQLDSNHVATRIDRILHPQAVDQASSIHLSPTPRSSESDSDRDLWACIIQAVFPDNHNINEEFKVEDSDHMGE